MWRIYHGVCYVYSVKGLLNCGEILLPPVRRQTLNNFYQTTRRLIAGGHRLHAPWRRTCKY